jgi:methylmalonyl-CoA carboxyltransferase large subunit
MVETTVDSLVSLIQDLRKELAALSERIAQLETPLAAAPAPPPPAKPPAIQPKAETQSGVTEEELLAISAALAAYLGVRVHIRQIRLISSRAWAQEGRASIQASHRLHS